MNVARVENSAAARRLALLWLIFCVIVTIALCVGLIVWRDPAFGPNGGAKVQNALVAWNAIPVLLVLLMLIGLTARPLLSAWLVLLALWIVFYIDALKISELGTPLMPGDVLLLGNLGEGGALLLARYLPQDLKHLLEVVAAVAVIALLAWKEPVSTVLHGRRRAALFAIALLVCASLLQGTEPWRTLYQAEAGGFYTWTPQAHAKQAGLFVHLLRYTWETGGELPAPDLAAAESALQNHRAALQEPTMAADRPDIVILQSESFFDPARLRGLEPAQSLPQYRRLAANARHGDLWVPTFGGGTIRTEFEVLTGIAMRYFPATQYPYFRLTATRVASIASTLAAQGYRTLAIHPHERSFWNRAAALSNMGFVEFDAKETFRGAPLQGYYTSDDALVDHILARLDDSTEPTLIFAISIENHGPYENYPNADVARRDAQPVPSDLSDDAKRTLRGYLYHTENADRSLGRLADALRKRPRRSLLLFYGDHLPALTQVFEETGFDDSAAAHEEPVPWLLLDTADTSVHEREDTAAFFLPALVLATAGVDDRSYFRVLEALRRADRVGPGWTPAEDQGLGALMQLRQRGEFHMLAAKPE